MARVDPAPTRDGSPTCPREATDINCSGSTEALGVVKAVNVAFSNAVVAAEYCAPCSP